MKAEFPKLELTPKVMPEFLLRMLYCEMHGIDVSQFHIVPVKMTQQTILFNKYSGFFLPFFLLLIQFCCYIIFAGYNSVAVFLHEYHDLMIMVINSYRKDLLDKVHFLAICAALTSISRVITLEAISILKPFVPELMAFNLFTAIIIILLFFFYLIVLQTNSS
jgi:AP-4 complex subunit epsilon-1